RHIACTGHVAYCSRSCWKYLPSQFSVCQRHPIAVQFHNDGIDVITLPQMVCCGQSFVSTLKLNGGCKLGLVPIRHEYICLAVAFIVTDTRRIHQHGDAAAAGQCDDLLEQCRRDGSLGIVRNEQNLAFQQPALRALPELCLDLWVYRFCYFTIDSE